MNNETVMLVKAHVPITGRDADLGVKFTVNRGATLLIPGCKKESAVE